MKIKKQNTEAILDFGLVMKTKKEVEEEIILALQGKIILPLPFIIPEHIEEEQYEKEYDNEVTTSLFLGGGLYESFAC